MLPSMSKVAPARIGALLVLGSLLAMLFVGTISHRAVASTLTVQTVRIGRNPSVIALDSHTNRIFVGNADDATVSVLDATSGAVLDTIALGHYPIAAAVDERYGRVFFLNTDGEPDAHGPGRPGSVSILDATSGALLRTSFAGYDAGALTVDESSGRVFITNSGDDTVNVLDALSGRVPRTITVAGSPWAVAVGEGALAVGGDSPGNVSVLDTRTGAVLRTIHLGVSALDAVASARTGRIFIATDRGLDVLDARAGVVVRSVRDDAIPLLSDERSGRVLVMASNGLRLLDARTGLPRSRTVPWSILGTLSIGGPATDVDAATGQIAVVTPSPSSPGRDDSGRVTLLNGYTGAVLRTMPVCAQPGAIAVNARAHRIYVTCAGVTPAADRGQTLLATLRRWLPWLPSPRPSPPAGGSVTILRWAPAPAT